MLRISINWQPTGIQGSRMEFEKQLATEITEYTEKIHGIPSVVSVYSDVTTSHSTKLAKYASQFAGYVANRG